jgi:ribose 5-phosphate isomerase B
MAQSPLVIASDHAGFDLKAVIRNALEAKGVEVLDLGPEDATSVDYPDMAAKLAKAMAKGVADRGVLICGTGIGIGIAANRYPYIRAALCHDVTTARLSRAHNDANVLCLGARTIGQEVALDCVDMFLATPFEGGRHQRRVDKLGRDGSS